jgi:hypothetical protein
MRIDNLNLTDKMVDSICEIVEDQLYILGSSATPEEKLANARGAFSQVHDLCSVVRCLLDEISKETEVYQDKSRVVSSH